MSPKLLYFGKNADADFAALRRFPYNPRQLCRPPFSPVGLERFHGRVTPALAVRSLGTNGCP